MPLQESIFDKIFNAKIDPFKTSKLQDELDSGESDTEFRMYYDDTRRPHSNRTMVPMCLYNNESEKLSRVSFPYIDRKTGISKCSKTEIPWWQADMSIQERAKWKKYSYWVFNISNLPPLPNGMTIFQTINKSQHPWNCVGMDATGLSGVPEHPNGNGINDKGILSYLNQANDSIWRFMAYTTPIPNTTKLYIYDTGAGWHVDKTISRDDPLSSGACDRSRFGDICDRTSDRSSDRTSDRSSDRTSDRSSDRSSDRTRPRLIDDFNDDRYAYAPNPDKMFTTKKATYGGAGPVGKIENIQLYITPDENSELTLVQGGLPYIWVCERNHNEFLCPASILVPFSTELYKIFPKTLKPLGYLTALRQCIKNNQNWIKYKAGNSNQIRSELLSMNYEQEVNPNWKTYVILLLMIILVIISFAIFYLFKK